MSWRRRKLSTLKKWSQRRSALNLHSSSRGRFYWLQHKSQWMGLSTRNAPLLSWFSSSFGLLKMCSNSPRLVLYEGTEVDSHRQKWMEISCVIKQLYTEFSAFKLFFFFVQFSQKVNAKSIAQQTESRVKCRCADGPACPMFLSQKILYPLIWLRL